MQPNFFYGSLLAYFGIEILLDWLVHAWFKVRLYTRLSAHPPTHPVRQLARPPPHSPLPSGLGGCMHECMFTCCASTQLLCNFVNTL